MSKCRVEIFLGPGGVGKTTASASRAVICAKESPNKKIKLVTIDPSKRVRDLFDMKENEESKKVLPNLTVSLNQREAVFKKFIEATVKEQLVKDKFYKSKFFKSLMSDLSVSQDFTSFYEIWLTVKSEKYDLLIIDTPPLQNSADFFEGVENLKLLFSNSVLKIFASEERGLLFKLINKGQLLAIRSLKALTGADFLNELEVFFNLISKIRKETIKIIDQTEKELEQNSECVMVASYNELSLRALNVFLKRLITKKIKIKKGYINKFDERQPDLVKTLLVGLEKTYRGVEFYKIRKKNPKEITLENFLEVK